MQLEQIHYPFSDSPNKDIGDNIILIASIAFIIIGTYAAYKFTGVIQNNQ